MISGENAHHGEIVIYDASAIYDATANAIFEGNVNEADRQQ